MSNITMFNPKERIAGTWKYCDGFSDVEFTFAVAGGELSVSIVDTFDGEIPEIYDIQWNESQLEISFAALWSTGRFLKYRVSVGPNENRVDATITATWQQLWERQ